MLTTDVGHKAAKKALAGILASRARVQVLAAFLLDPTRAYYQRQLEQATGLAIRAVQRELERFMAVGLLFRHAEGNRAYYQVDQDFPLYPELRALFMKAAGDAELLRGLIATDAAARLCFLADSKDRALVVAAPGRAFDAPETGAIAVEVMSSEVFIAALAERDEALAPFLARGVDLLGRREDIVWRHIEAAGYSVPKGDGVP